MNPLDWLIGPGRIRVSGGVAVSTDSLREAESGLAAVGTHADRLAAELRLLEVGEPRAAGVCEREFATAVAALHELAWRADRARAALGSAAATYDGGEALLVGVLHDLADAAPTGDPLWSARVASLLTLLQAAQGSLPRRAVTVERVDSDRASEFADLQIGSAAGFGELARRVPQGDHGDAEVRIERYEPVEPGMPAGPDGRPRWIVYIGGTRDFELVAGDDPWDLVSDAEEVAGRHSDARQATESAMASAGIERGDEVVFVGYSLGGLVATSLVRSGGYRVPALVTLGSPTRAARLPGSVQNVAVEHLDDPVPYTGGVARPAAAGREDRVVVSRFSNDALVSKPGSGHDIDRYRETARRMDSAGDARLGAATAAISRLTGGSKPAVTFWRGERAAVDPQGGPVGRGVSGRGAVPTGGR